MQAAHGAGDIKTHKDRANVEEMDKAKVLSQEDWLPVTQMNIRTSESCNLDQGGKDEYRPRHIRHAMDNNRKRIRRSMRQISVAEIIGGTYQSKTIERERTKPPKETE